MVRTVRTRSLLSHGRPDTPTAVATTVTAGMTQSRGSWDEPSQNDSLRDQLDLPRRSGFAGRQARPRDLAERRAADDVAGRAEVGVVEEIEHVDAELQTRALRPAARSSLTDRSVLWKAGSDHDVPAEIAEAVDGHEHRRIEPLVDRADDADRAVEIRTHGVRQRRSGSRCSSRC